MVVTDGTALNGVFKPAPRIGFGWDLTGDGKTALRGGAGMFYDRYSDDTILRLIEPPPLLETWRTNFTTLSELLSSPLVASVNPGVRAFTERFAPPTVYNWSLSVQRELPWKLVGDVAYVGNAGRDFATTVQINNFGYGTTRVDLNPQNGDPSQNNTQARPADYLRPYRGYSTIQNHTWQGYNNYHSVQLSLNRRMSNGLAWGLAYTGSIRRSLGTIDPFLSEEENTTRNYTANGSRPHNLVFNYNYNIPNLSQRWNNLMSRALFDGWQISGVSIFQSGTRGGFSFNNNQPFTGAPFNDMTGGPGGAAAGTQRVFLACDPNLPRGERTPERQFRTECVQAPGPRSDASDIYYLGNALNDEYVGLGYMNHDISFFKNVPLGNGRRLQFRAELYNAFNNTQFGTVDTSAQFNFLTGEQTDPNFGRVTASRTASARVIQLGVRFTF
jgi:hypothetical protein